MTTEIEKKRREYLVTQAEEVAARGRTVRAKLELENARSSAIREVQRLGVLAEATADLLTQIQALLRNAEARDTLVFPLAVWERREELEPLAQSLGFTIVEHAALRNRAVIAWAE